MTNTDKYIVLLGLDEDKKPRAARFDYADETAVRKLAAIKGFQIGHAKSDDAVAIAARLVNGKIFQSGKGLVPLVNAAAYENLLKLLEVEPATPSKPAQSEKPLAPPSSVPNADLWESIGVGQVVLCPNEEKGKDRSWWETTVMAISSDRKTLTLRWTHYPTLKPFKFPRRGIAILPPKKT